VDTMRVLVTGTGHSGTTLLREVVINLGTLKFHSNHFSKEEDRTFFKRKILPENYMTKLATPNPPFPNAFTIEALIQRMTEYSDLHLLFSFRHPVDTCMSKIVRGQRHSDGGDKYWESVSPDGTVTGAILAVKLAHEIHRRIWQLFPKRIMAVSFGNLLLAPKKEITKIARFLGVEVTRRALVFYRYNSNPYQFRRYGTALDRSQVGLHTRWRTAYNGFFKDREKDINKLREAFKC